MPSRKQRRRMEKERRHQYETVWVDADGNELEEPPDDPRPAPRERRPDAKKPKSQQKRPDPRARVPQPPSWRRAIRRGVLLGLVITLFFYIANSKASAGGRVGAALVWGVGYTAIFIPFTFGLDRFVYRRWERKANERPTKR